MNVSDGMFEKVWNDLVELGGTRDALKKALKLLPEPLTVGQVESAITAAGWGHLIRGEIIRRLTQQTPAAPDVQNDVKPSYVATPSPYVSSYTTSEMKYPDAPEYEHVLGEKAQVTPDAEPSIPLAEHKAKMREAIKFCVEKWAQKESE